MRLSVSDVRDSLTPEQVIHSYGLQTKRRGSQFRLSQCPRCHEKSTREAIAIDAQTGHWCHHGHERAAGGECSGDILDLVAACEGLTTKHDFARVLQRAAEIAGVSGIGDVELELRRQQQAERARLAAIEERKRSLDARDTASVAWERLSRRDSRGEAYLETRSLDSQILISKDAVRFSTLGIVVAIRDVDGCPVSTATRRYDGQPKVLALKDHSTRGTMIGAIADIVHSKPVVLVEGVVDALTALQAWPDSIVLGANGAGNVPKVAEAAITRIKLAATNLLLVPHDDEPGIRAMTQAGQTAMAAGLELDEALSVVNLPAPDLNAAWSEGWRP